MFTVPPVLRPGDQVALLAPSSHQLSGKESYVEKAVKVLEDWGLRVVLQEKHADRHFYLAGEDTHRARQFQKMYLNPDIKAIFTTRGGYGASRLLSYFQPESFAACRKMIVGSSDITSLLVYFQRICGMVVFHGPCLATDQFLTSPKHSETQESLYRWMFDPDYQPVFETQAIVPGKTSGVLVGGCLSLLVTTLGTSFELETEDRILFIEDVNEPPFRIDRMLTHLKNAGKLSRLKGVVFGSMTGCEGKDGLLWEILKDLFQEVPYPVIFGIPSGHGEVGLTLALGKEVSMDTDRGTMRYERGRE